MTRSLLHHATCLNVEVQHSGELNPVSLLDFDSVVMTVAAAKRIEERFA